MIRFKKRFLFLSSFLFKIPAILSQQAVSNINVSQQSFSSFSFFLSFFFSLTWEKFRSHQDEACNKIHSLIYCWGNRILLVSLFLFWIHIIPIFRKGGRKNSLSCTNLWKGLLYRFLSFRFLSPELAELACRFCQCLSRTKDSFPNFHWRKRWHLVNGPSIWLFPCPTIPSGDDTRVTWIPFFVQQITDHGVRVALTFILQPF